MKPIRTNLYKRKYPGKKFIWVVRWRDPSTNHWRGKKVGPSRDEALAVEAQVRQSLILGQEPFETTSNLKKCPSLLEVSKYFYQSPRFLGLSEKWKQNLAGRLDRAVLPQIGEMGMTDLNRQSIYKYYFTLKERGLSHATIRQYHYALCLLGDAYIEIEPSAINPFRLLTDFKKRFPRQAPTRDINFLSEEELGRLFLSAEKSKSERLAPFIRILAGTGMRRTEALELKWKDIDWSGGFIHIRKSKNRRARVIPLEKPVSVVLRALPTNGSVVFCNQDGKPYDRDSFLEPLKAAVKHAKIDKRVDLHTLRHSYGSNKIRQGWGLKKVSVLLGHSDISITAQIYSHLLDGDLKVRDEFHFDKFKQLENSVDSENVEEQMVSAINKLADILSGDKSDTLTPDVMNRALRSVLRQSETITTNQNQPATTPSNGVHCATPVLRGIKTGVEKQKKGDSVKSQPFVFLQSLMADPTGLEPVTFRSVV